MASTSKLEYLKRYMSKEDDTKKKPEKYRKKKKCKISKTKNVKIIDCDIQFKDANNFGRDEESDFNNFEDNKDKPTVFAEDGITLLTKIDEEGEKNKRQMWNPISLVNTQGKNEDKKFCKHNGKDRSRHRNRESPELDLLSCRTPAVDRGGLLRKTASLTVSPDLSPPRKQRHDSPDSSPRTRYDSPEISPPRVEKSRHVSPDISAPRKTRHDSPDLSPPRKPTNSNSDESDLSPPRNVRGESPDLSPPRKDDTFDHRNDIKVEVKDKQHRKAKRRERSPEIVFSGKKAGLQSAEALRKENQFKRKQEDKLFKEMDPSLSGKDTETTYRDKSGRKIDLKIEKIKKREEEEKKAKEDEKFMKWGKGMKQAEDYKKKLEEDSYESSKPLARYQSDKDLDNLLKERELEDDPMLAYMQKKKKTKTSTEKEIPRYKGPAPPPNRFNIWPGYRWDGVDRSNGFEVKRFNAMSERKTLAQEAYKWSVEDM